ncbi:hypothetical protein BCR35DRAFT_329175 [Leucosporidium creatinivorum]|uniref:Uncharacterized protein n=1 Tax=Leucosporidium creatinivorum TaxID=106004 RepID=A0A1Y2G031_9BASI|nr:hypothetical protein BCR35DRAFT_329175 [Leucosporidium creatinivorum]
MAAVPQIVTRTLTLELDDPALPIFFAQLTSLRDSLLINLGSNPLPFSIANDLSCAMPRPTGPATSTAVSKSASSSLSLSAKLSKRYKRQVFLSLDLSSCAGGQGGSTDHVLLPLERALLKQLDPVVRGV